jgi:sigma-B regulation protein RsbU (phosphoserine phosphatase)
MKRDVKILIVDDSTTMRQTLKLILERIYTVEDAEDGYVALEIYPSFKPDIILLDLNMPRIDGFGVIEHIRSVLNDQDVFILVLTAEDLESFKPRALNLGANDFLYKPFERTELIARVGVAERQIRLTRQLREYLRKASLELEMVASLQIRLLPRERLSFKGLHVNNLYLPSGLASGDYYDYFPVAENVLRCVTADVSGHGARAAFIMGIVRTLFRLATTAYLDLRQTMTLINEHLIDIVGEESDFVTVFAADIDVVEHRMVSLNCGHCPGMLLTPEGETVRLTPQTTFLGFFPMRFEQEEAPFPPGSQLFLYTDGFFEWELEPRRQFGLERFWALAEKSLKNTGTAPLVNLMSAMAEAAQDKPRFTDDLTALLIRFGADT